MGLFHSHKWRPVASEKLVQQHFERRTGRAYPEEPITEVLQRCAECGAWRTITLDGYWSEEQLGLTLADDALVDG